MRCRERFSGPLNSTNLNNGFVRINEPIRYHTDIVTEGVVEIERGFESDGPSIPWPANLIVPRSLEWMREAVLHDKVFRTGTVQSLQPGNEGLLAITRKQADLIIAEALSCNEEVSDRRRAAIYAGLRIGSWRAWNYWRRRDRQAAR